MAKADKLFEKRIEEAERRFKDRRSEVEVRRKHLSAGGDWRRVEEPSRVLHRMMSLGLSDLASDVLSRETVEAPVPSALREGAHVGLLERIIEENDLIASRFLRIGDVRTRAVGRVLINGGRSGYGTGFLVAPRLLMTNNHVIDTPSSASRSSIEFDYYQRVDGTTSPTQVFDLEPEAFFLTNTALDFTVVAVAEQSRDDQPLSRRGWVPLIRESGKALIGEPVNIIQHPGGEPQQIAIRNNEVTDLVGDFVHYDADTKRGSSGSAVFNMQWELVALHHAGVPDRNDDGRILLNDGSAWDGSRADAHRISWIANEGVRISSIVKAILESLDGESASELFTEGFQTPVAPERVAQNVPQPPVVEDRELPPTESVEPSDEELDRLSPEQVARHIAELEERSLEITGEAASPGEVLVAEGDSWFDYSVAGLDIIDNLRRMGYQIHNVAEAGDTLDNMAWGTDFRKRNWKRRRPPLEETLDAVRTYTPRVVLLSGGGNDVAGESFGSYLNHKEAGQASAVREDYVDYMIKRYFRSAFEYIAGRIWELDKTIHIVCHGYGHAPPDGRGVINILGMRFVGPWLRPALTAKGYTNRGERERIVHDLIDRFNDMLRAWARDDAQGRIHFIDLRPLIGPSDWENELHLRNSAYRRVAKAFHREIQGIHARPEFRISVPKPGVTPSPLVTS